MTSRRLPALVAALGLATALLTSCGDDGAATVAGPSRSVTDIAGTTMDVPEDPQRVITLSEPTLDAALALGITPIGTVSGRGQSTVPNYLADLAADIPLMGAVANPDFEVIAESEPDLILVDGTSINNNPDALTLLRKIAPTFEAGYAGGDWRTNLEHVADALNLADEADDLVTAYESQVAEARPALAGYDDATFSIVRWQGSSASLILKELPAGVALTDLGLARPAVQDRRGRGHSEPVSLENIADIDADWIFFGTLGGSSVSNTQAGGSSDTAAAEQALAEARQVPGFSGLRAVQADQVVTVDGSLWTSTGGPLLMSRLVDNVVEELG